MKPYIAGVVLAAFGAAGAAAQENLGFETSDDGRPARWATSGAEYEIAVDHDVTYEGTSSLRLARAAADPSSPNAFSAASQSLDATELNATRIRVVAAVRTADVNGGYAALWLRIDGEDGIVFLDPMIDRPITGTNEWQQYEVTAPIADEARQIHFGALFNGTGTAWFDAFELALDDTGTLPPPSMAVSAYVEAALDVMEEHSIRRDEIDWDRFRRTTHRSIRGIDEIADSHFALRAGIARLGDNHSSFISPERARLIDEAGPESDQLMPWSAPAAQRLGDEIGYVVVPAYNGSDTGRMTRYADELQAAIAQTDSPAVCGWIIDLRANGGGNVFPMLAGLGPILGEGDAGGGLLADGTLVTRTYRDGASGIASVSGVPYRLMNRDASVAILIGPRTASSGEAAALAFIGRPNVRSFGLPTAGYTTGNSGFPLEDGALLNLAVSVMTDATGKPYPNGIVPDVRVESTSSDGPAVGEPVAVEALAWLREQSACERR